MAQELLSLPQWIYPYKREDRPTQDPFPTMSQRRVCDFYQKPQGCRYGSNCRFLHEPLDTSSPPPAFTPHASQNPRPYSAPDSVCYFHWSGGTCKRANCWFKHVLSDESPSASPTLASSWRPRPPTALFAPLPIRGNSLLKPGEAKHQLSTVFLKLGFGFGLPSTVNSVCYDFGQLFCFQRMGNSSLLILRIIILYPF